MPTSSYLKNQARERLSRSAPSKQVLLVYIGVLAGMSLAFTLIQMVLSLQIRQTSGLSGMSMRSTLSTISNFLPIVQSVVQMCLSLGFLSAMLRVARGQGLSVHSLRLGFDRFWQLLGMNILRALMYLALGIGCMYLTLMIFLATPLSDSLRSVLENVSVSDSILSGGVLALDDATMVQATAASLPYFVLFALVCCAVLIPFSYRYRLAEYYLVDNPGGGAVSALRSSRSTMRGNKWNYFKLDLSFWWYYLLSFCITLVLYGDLLLDALGVSLPFTPEVSSMVFFLLYLLIQSGVLYAFGRKVEVTYACAYDALCPKPQSDGVVLGNIFNM